MSRRNKYLPGHIVGAYEVLAYEGAVGGASRYRVRCTKCMAEKICFLGNMLGSKSCGCEANKAAVAAILRHGHCRDTSGKHGKTAIYKTWEGMRYRCSPAQAERHPNYAGRGIQVCPRWRDSFENFLTDMGEPPTSEHSLDRIDNDGNYEPGNCRWATRAEQGSNRRTNIVIKIGDRSMSAMEWGQTIGINPMTIYSRIRLGWQPERAVMAPVQKKRMKVRA